MIQDQCIKITKKNRVDSQDGKKRLKEVHPDRLVILE
jgi:hypothetical protein